MASTPLPLPQRSQAFLRDFSLEFEDERLIVLALQAAGAQDRDGNKKLALIGDSILRLIIHLEGFNRGMSRGMIDDMVKRLACNAHLAECGFTAGLDAYIWNNPSQGNKISDNLMATTVEAILGAVFLDNDQDLAAVQTVMAMFGLTWPE
ncbi:ribonuclease III [Aspergillus similis]